MRLSPVKAVALGTLTVAVLDIADAIIYYGFRGATPVKIFQSISVGLLGRDAAYGGGAATALLGAALHCFNSLMVVLVFYLAATQIRWLTGRPYLAGTLYGLVVYGVMYLVVLPLSKIGFPHFRLPDVADEVFIHIFGVGIPAALFVRAAVPHDSVTDP
jgi:hypothetical protein